VRNQHERAHAHPLEWPRHGPEEDLEQRPRGAPHGPPHRVRRPLHQACRTLRRTRALERRQHLPCERPTA
jgi:hypothetical protein